MIQDIYPHVLNNAFVPDRAVDPEGFLFLFRGGEVLSVIERDQVLLPRVRQVPSAGDLRYLFTLDDSPCYLAMKQPDALPNRFGWNPVRDLRRRAGGPREIIFAAWTAYQLNNWYLDNRFCGRCSKPTVLATDERAVICPACNRRIYPRIIPAVIVGVTNGDEILMTKYRGRDIPYYALIAGFTEIGETLEQTVAREVMEEAGLKVKNIRYYKSQPWGIVDDLLAGFYCDVDGSTDIHMDTGELKEAVWVRRGDVIGQPNDFSLTNEMMLLFRDGGEPKM
ncbi:MAG: NAD(+) diphosphatase [Clostridia bacterium]|nr:NAD(+) diphosphatase [Clostridia bacterium]